jgi:hypothetical protein
LINRLGLLLLAAALLVGLGSSAAPRRSAASQPATAYVPRPIDAPRGVDDLLQPMADWLSPRLVLQARRDAATAHRSWGVVGLNGGGAEGLVGNDGEFAGGYPGNGFNFWLRDNRTGQTFRPTRATVSQALVDGYLPLIQSTWNVDGVTLVWTAFADSTGANPIGRSEADPPLELVRLSATAGADGGSWSLLAVALPDDPAQTTAPIRWIAATDSTIAVNDRLAFVAARPADFVATVDQDQQDPLKLDLTDASNRPTSAISDDGLGLGLLGYKLDLFAHQSAAYDFALPLGDAQIGPDQTARVASLNFFDRETRVRQAWAEQLGQVDVSLPDRQLTDAFYAAISHLLMARGDGTIFSGPTAEHAVWVRDSAYITMALDRAGQAKAVPPILKFLASVQLPSGREPPIVEANGLPRQPLKTEWDAQGELIHQIVDYAIQNGDDAYLRQMYPVIQGAARFQQQQIDEASIPSLVGTPFYGILPAGESAEDLYNSHWHHNWDDFWALTGFADAASAARRLGFAADAAQFTAQEATLRANVLSSIMHSNAPLGPYYIWDGPEDTGSTAMARSSTPAIWPEEVLDPSSALVRGSFDRYFQTWVAPYGGAYHHYGNDFWPYAGLDLAHIYWRLGMDDRAWSMLDWVMSHQTSPNLYAWGEVVDPKRFDVVSGDLPHSWMSAELILFVREIVLGETADAFTIGPYPTTWLQPGANVSVHHLPTRFGEAGYVLTRSTDGQTISLALEGAVPPGGYQLAVPDVVTLVSATTPTGVSLPVEAHRVEIPRSVNGVTVQITVAPSNS